MSCSLYMVRESLASAFLSGAVERASEISNQRFKNQHPMKRNDILKDLKSLGVETVRANMDHLIASIQTSSVANFIIESRIKSPASIFSALADQESNENEICMIRDLVGFRLLVDCQNFNEFYVRSLDCFDSLLSTTLEHYTINFVRVFDSSFHPYQLIHLGVQSGMVHIEIKIMNSYYIGAFMRTLYPLWEGHRKNKFPIVDMIDPFQNKELVWGLTCSALTNQTATLPFENYQCKCGHNGCDFEKDIIHPGFTSYCRHVRDACEKRGIQFVLSE